MIRSAVPISKGTKLILLHVGVVHSGYILVIRSFLMVPPLINTAVVRSVRVGPALPGACRVVVPRRLLLGLLARQRDHDFVWYMLFSMPRPGVTVVAVSWEARSPVRLRAKRFKRPL